ncbi:hypothetical protein [Salinisphaera sp.]|uniref:hypothetical protein n=1 Tax=Salinisphaera sp. TaxID=1914330 RepID=UPI000C6ABB2D|nr:hypothetical protein [Salinisphaera sp.]MBS63982.1 hypothetical protein [Salinisphaera sp.]
MMIKNLPKYAHFVFLTLCFAFNIAYGATFEGIFSSGEKYRANYSIETKTRPNEPATKLLTVKVDLESGQELSYSYEASDFPAVHANPLGFISIVVNQGGMEGSRTYNYLFLSGSKLVSAGEVETLLHLGSVEDILIQKNEEISESAIREFMSSVANERSEEFSNPDHAYPNAMLIILGKSYTEDLRFDAAHSLLDNKEIKEDPVLLTRLKSSFCN